MKSIRDAVGVSKSAKLHRMTGGAAHSDESADRKLIDRMVKPEARTGRAAGGSTKAKAHKGKPSVTVNVVSPRGPGQPVPVPVPVRVGAPGGGSGPALSRVPSPPPGQPSGPAPIPVKNVPPQQGPLGPINSRNGGKIKKRANGGSVKFTGGAESGVGRLQKVAAQKAKG